MIVEVSKLRNTFKNLTQPVQSYTVKRKDNLYVLGMSCRSCVRFTGMYSHSVVQ